MFSAPVIDPGKVPNPLGEDRGVFSANGLIGLGTAFFRLLIIAAGVFALFNFVMAGMQFITSQGDPKAMESARQKIFMSIVGLAVIASSFMLAALVGLIFFGDGLIFLDPTIATANP